MGFRALRVINEDVVAPGQGFGMHGHRDMEIVTLVLAGALEHRDSLGNGEVLKPGELQRMSAGTGITHSEFNPSATQPVHLYQIWLLPERNGLQPSYEQKAFTEQERRGTLRLVASPTGEFGSLTIHQDARLYLATPGQPDEERYEARAEEKPPERASSWPKIEEGVAAGLSPAEARRRAMLAMGGVEQRKEEMRDTRRVSWLTEFLADLSYAVRSLRRTPALSAFVVVTLFLKLFFCLSQAVGCLFSLISPLCEWHCAAVVPAIDDFCNALHCAAASPFASKRNGIDVGLMYFQIVRQIGNRHFGLFPYLQSCNSWLSNQFFETADGQLVFTLLALPNR
jgi:hypothetical protein